MILLIPTAVVAGLALLAVPDAPATQPAGPPATRTGGGATADPATRKATPVKAASPGKAASPPKAADAPKAPGPGNAAPGKPAETRPAEPTPCEPVKPCSID
jgi:hypothetical protein